MSESPEDFLVRKKKLISMLQKCRLRGIDKDFCKKAVKLLIQKSEQHQSIQQVVNLYKTVTTFGKYDGGCVTVPKSKDGRQTIGGKRAYVHAHYAKIWRWSDLDYRKTDLEPVDVCDYGYGKKMPMICVNPYHYRRITKTRSSTNYADGQSNKSSGKKSTEKMEVASQSSSVDSNDEYLTSESSMDGSSESQDSVEPPQEEYTCTDPCCYQYKFEDIQYELSISPDPVKITEAFFEQVVEFQKAAPPSEVIPQKRPADPVELSLVKVEEEILDDFVIESFINEIVDDNAIKDELDMMTVDVKMEPAASADDFTEFFDLLDPDLEISDFLNSKDPLAD